MRQVAPRTRLDYKMRQVLVLLNRMRVSRSGSFGSKRTRHVSRARLAALRNFPTWFLPPPRCTLGISATFLLKRRCRLWIEELLLGDENRLHLGVGVLAVLCVCMCVWGGRGARGYGMV